MKTDVESIFGISSESEFEALALETFRFQAANNHVYKSFIHHLGRDASHIQKIEEIPFLPIHFFKTHAVVSFNEAQTKQVFLSSATTGVVQSQHKIFDLNLYQKSYITGFERFYGPVNSYCFLALLPSYQEREGSSLIYMVDDLIKLSGHPDSGYFLNNNASLIKTLSKLKSGNQKTVLIGVTYALLDLIEFQQINFPSLIVMETGGMKGRRKEMVRPELHHLLKQGFGVPEIHSEYGMTELLGQAYALKDGAFSCPAWLRVLIRDINDPFTYVKDGKSGGINIIDLSNRYSCSFIATQDLGRMLPDKQFEVLGRFDHSDIRGCNLLVQ